MHWRKGDEHMAWVVIWWFFGTAVLAAGVWAQVKSARAPADSKESSIEILKRRYASGEIDEKTYEHMLEELGK